MSPRTSISITPDHLLGTGAEGLRSAAEALHDDHADDRELRAAVHSACDGIELILKGLLIAEHWSLVFDDPGKADLHKFASGDFRSASFEDCLARVQNVLGLTLPESGKSLQSFRKKRNRMVHMGLVDNVFALRASIGEALHGLLLVVEEAASEGLLPDGHDSLHTQLTRDLNGFREFVRARMNDVRPKLGGGDGWECPACGQNAALIEDGLSCLFCGAKLKPEDAAEHYVSSVLGMGRYSVVTDGGEWPVHRCPECSEDTLVSTDGLVGRHICFACGEEWEGDALIYCIQCGEPFRNDRETSMCSDCFRHNMGNDD